MIKNKFSNKKIVIVSSVLFFFALTIIIGVSSNKIDFKNVFAFLNQSKATGAEQLSVPVITLNGSDVTLGKGQPYVEPGYSAHDTKYGDLTNNVVITGTVDENVAGIYYVKYNVENEDGQVAKEVIRTVKVVENANPVIELLGLTKEDDNYYYYVTDVKKPFEVPAYIATDMTTNEDLTSQVMVVNNVTTNTLTGDSYLVVDYMITFGGKTVTETLKVSVVDREKPVIKLIGPDTYRIPLNTNPQYIEEYIEAGAMVIDNYYENVPVSITSLSGDIEYDNEGTYTIEYNAVDGSNNVAASVRRTVIIEDTGKPKVTFVENGNEDYEKSISLSLNVWDIETGLSEVCYSWSEKVVLESNHVYQHCSNNATFNETIELNDITGVYYLHVRAVDNSTIRPNVITTRSDAYLIDNTGPKIDITPLNTAIANSIKAFAFISDKESNIPDTGHEYKWVEVIAGVEQPSTWLEYENGKILEQTTSGSYYLCIRAIDNLGNESIAKSELFSIGEGYPSVEIEMPIEDEKELRLEPSQTHSATIKAEAIADATLTMVKYIWLPRGSDHPNFEVVNPKITSVSLSGTTYEENVILNEDGLIEDEDDYFLWVQVTDSNGNKSVIVSSKVVLDSKAPIISLSNTNSDIVSNYITRINALDNHLLKVEYAFLSSDKSPIEADWELLDLGDNQVSFDAEQLFYDRDNIDKKDTFYLWVRAVDSVGNNNNDAVFKSQLIKLNAVQPGVPEINIEDKWSNSLEVSITNSSMDAVNGEVIKYSTSAVKYDDNYGELGWEDYDESFNVTENKYIYAKTVNKNTGFESDVVRKEITKIDIIKPVVAFDPYNNNIIANSISSSFRVTDSESELNSNEIYYLWKKQDTMVNVCAIDETVSGNWISVTGDYTSDVTENAIINKSEDSKLADGVYCLYVKAEDNAGNKTIAYSPYVYKVDATKPVLDIVDSENQNIGLNRTVVLSPSVTGEEYFGLSYFGYLWSKDLTENYASLDGFIEVSGVPNNIYSPAGLNGKYYLYIKAIDNAGNIQYKVSDAYEFMNGRPSVEFTPVYGSTALKLDIEVKVYDVRNQLVTNNLYYKFVSSELGQPDKEDFTLQFTDVVSLDNSYPNGEYNLWIYAKDSAGNEVITSSGPYTISNIEPTITLVGDEEIVIDLGQQIPSSVLDNNGAFAKDIDGSALTVISDIKGVNVKKAGIYTITYKATPTIGEVLTVTRTIIVRPVITDLNVYATPIQVGKDLVVKQATVKLGPGETAKIGPVFYDGEGNVIDSTEVTKKPGSYLAIYSYITEDTEIEAISLSKSITVIDTKLPTITFDANDTSIHQKQYTKEVTIFDFDLKVSSLKYIWNDSSTLLTAEDFKDASLITSLSSVAINASGTEVIANIPSLVGETGNRYLHIYAEDSTGNVQIKKSKVVKLDNESPKVTITPDGKEKWTSSSTATIKVTDLGVKTDSLKYKWVTDKTNINAASFTGAEEFNSGDKPSTPDTANFEGVYYLCVYAEDNAGNTPTINCSEGFNIDNKKPLVSFNLNGNDNYAESHSTTVTVEDVNLNIGSLKYKWFTTAGQLTEEDFATGAKKFTSGQTISTPVGVTGDYYLGIYAKDNAGNIVIIKSNVFKLGSQEIDAEISFSPNGSAGVIAKKHITVVTVDGFSLNTESFKYLWNNGDEPTASDFDDENTFESGVTEIRTPSKETGDFYLWIYVEDNDGNSIIEKSNVFEINNTKPTIVLAEDDENGYFLEYNQPFVDPGYSALDYDGITELTDFIITSTVEIDKAGVYAVIYSVKDSLGNWNTVKRTVKVRPLITPPADFSHKLGTDFTYPKATVTIAPGNTFEIDPTGTIDKDVENDYTLYYNVTYAEVDATQKTTIVTVIEMADPTIILKQVDGKDDIIIDYNQEFTDPGAIATDSDGSDLSVSSNYDTVVKNNVAGRYVVTYTATTSLGETLTITRTVDVRPLIEDLVVTTPLELGKTLTVKKATVRLASNKTEKIDPIFYDSEDNVVASDKVTSKLGTYKAVYSYTMGDTGIEATSVEKDIIVQDTVKPTVTFNEDGQAKYEKQHTTEVTIFDLDLTASSLKYVWSTSAATLTEADFEDADLITSLEPITVSDDGTEVIVTIPTPVGATANCYLNIYAEDATGNIQIKRSKAFKVDNESPKVTFSPNKKATLGISYSTILKVTDLDLKTESLKYIWVTDITDITAASFEKAETFTSGDSKSTPEGVEGIYFVCVYAEDNAGNVPKIQCSDVFNIDDKLPEIKFVENGNSKLEQTHSTIVTVEDVNLTTGSLKYKWVNTTDELTVEDFATGATSFTNGQTISTPVDESGDYYLWIYAEDKAGNGKVLGSNVFKLDNDNPGITIFGDNPLRLTLGGTFKTPSMSVADNSEETIIPVLTDGSVNMNVADTYILTYTATDSSGNVGTATLTVIVEDVSVPTVTFGTNGNTKFEQTHSTTVTVNGTNIDLGSLKYKWVNTTDELTVEDFATGATSFTNGQTISTPVDESGDYYLWIYAEYNGVGKLVDSSNVFKLDNDNPDITISGDNPLRLTLGGTFKTPSMSVADNSEETIIPVLTDGSVNMNVANTYILTYTATDSSGNVGTATLTVIVEDNAAPTVLFGTNGNSVYAKNYSTTVTVNDLDLNTGSLKYKWINTIATLVESDFATGATSFTSGQSVSTPVGVTGDYYLWIIAKDNSGNTTIEKSNVFKVDNAAPTVSFGTNGNGTYANSHSTTVTVNDLSIKTLKYKWVNTTATLVESDFATGATSFTSGQSISTPSGSTGNYYLWIYTEDTAGNKTIEGSNVFKVDTAAPTVLFGTNGNSVYAKNYSTTVTVNDLDLNTGSLKYKWINTTATLVESDFATGATSFTSGQSVSTPVGVTGDYYLWIIAKDNSGNTTIEKSNIFKVDNAAPTVSFGTNGNGTYANSHSTTVTVNDLSIKTLKYKWVNTTATLVESDFATGATVFTSGQSISTPSGSTGNYYLWIYTEDTAGNKTIEGSNVFKVDNAAPTITFGTNGNSVYAKSQSTTVTIADLSIKTLKYKWVNTTSPLVESSFDTGSTTFTNGQSISISGVTGDYYLWIYTEDTAGNKTIKGSNVFKVDNTAPTVLLNGSSSVTVVKDNAYTELGAGVTDNSGEVLGVIITGSVNINVVNTYTLTYTATDSSGNKGTATRTVNVIDNNVNNVIATDLGCTVGSECNYKGSNPSNYVWYSGYLWRIVKSNSDGSIKLITDENISALSYHSSSYDFDTSYVKNWLNNYFYPSLNANNIIRTDTSFCNDVADYSTTTKTTCSYLVPSKLGLITLSEYNIATDATGNYLNINQRFITMSPAYGYTKYLYTVTENNTIVVGNDIIYNTGVRPVINVKKDTKIESGNGTYSNPYRFKDDVSATSSTKLSDRYSGEYVKFANKTWRIVSSSTTGTKLVMDSYYETGSVVKRTFDSMNTMTSYLNSTVYNSLFTNSTDQSKIVENTTWYNDGHAYGDNVLTSSLKGSSSYTSTVGLMRVGELLSSQIRTNATKSTYWTGTLDRNNSIYFFATSYNGQSNTEHMLQNFAIRPVIILNSSVTIASGTGTYSNPYILN